MFENVDGRTTDAGVTGILIAHLRAFGSGELTRSQQQQNHRLRRDSSLSYRGGGGGDGGLKCILLVSNLHPRFCCC